MPARPEETIPFRTTPCNCQGRGQSPKAVCKLKHLIKGHLGYEGDWVGGVVTVIRNSSLLLRNHQGMWGAACATARPARSSSALPAPALPFPAPGPCPCSGPGSPSPRLLFQKPSSSAAFRPPNQLFMTVYGNTGGKRCLRVVPTIPSHPKFCMFLLYKCSRNHYNM